MASTSLSKSTAPAPALPTLAIAIIKEQTGSVIPGLFGLAAVSLLAAVLVYFLRERRRPTPEADEERAPVGQFRERHA